MHLVIAYDIEDDRRRNKVMSTLKDFGLRVQYSVFECDLDSGRFGILRERLTQIIDRRRDKLHIYSMCEMCFFRTESLGAEPRADGRL